MKNNRKELAYYTRRLCERGLTTSLGGNLSTRFKNGFLITASGRDKAVLQSRDICRLDSGGQSLRPVMKPSIETGIHLAVYKARPDVRAVIHAHPVCASAFCASTSCVNTRLTAEARVILGTPVKTPYALSGSNELADHVVKAVTGKNPAGECNVILMQNHGVIALGASLIEAFHRIEVLEDAAKMTLACTVLGKVVELSEEEIEALLVFFGK